MNQFLQIFHLKKKAFITLCYHDHHSKNKLIGEDIVQKSKLSISKLCTAKNKLKQKLDSFYLFDINP